MVTNKLNILSVSLAVMSLICACSPKDRDTLDIPSEVAILDFRVGDISASIIKDTIRLVMPRGTNLAQITPQITVTKGATVTPASGEMVNLKMQPVNYRVSLGNIYQDYYVSAITDDVPRPHTHGRRIGYINWEDTEKTGGQERAWQWLQTVYPDSCDLLSLWDIQHASLDMDAYSVIWYYTRGVAGDGTLPFRAYDNELVEQMRAYTNGGGKLLLTGMAPRWLQTLGIIENQYVPNNFYGHESVRLDVPAGFKPIAKPELFASITKSGDGSVELMGVNCTFENNTSAWYLASWGGYNNSISQWEEETGGIAIATDIVDGGTATRVVMAEFPVTEKRSSQVISINTGTYDWGNHDTNPCRLAIEQLTKNSIDYLRNSK